MRIFVTRHHHQRGYLEEGIVTAGYEPVFWPLTVQKTSAPDEGLQELILALQEGFFGWVLFTSGNTVRSLVELGWTGTVAGHTKIGVVGAGTAKVLREVAGIESAWQPTSEASALGILRDFPPVSTDTQSGTATTHSRADRRIFLPQSAQARPLLFEGLMAKGWEVTPARVYETVPLPASGPAPQGGDIVVITSSSAVESFVGQYPGQEFSASLRLVAIGHPTAESLRSHGIEPADVLREPTAAGVVESLRRLLL